MCRRDKNYPYFKYEVLKISLALRHILDIETMIYLQAQANPIMQFLPLIGIFVVFYFFFIRPQQKKAKDQSNFLANINKGDDVVMSSGIIGKINKIEDEIVTLQIDQKTFIRIAKSSISKEMTEATKLDA